MRRRREPVAGLQGSRHLEPVSHRDSNDWCDLELCQNGEPKRKQTRDSRILHDEEWRGTVFLKKQERQVLAQLQRNARTGP